MKVLILAAYAVFALRRLMTYLHIFQQEEYDGVRFVRWMARSGAVDRRATVLLAAIGITGVIGGLSTAVTHIPASLVFLVLAYFESDPRSSGKKPLVMTQRARRTMAGAALAAGLMGLAIVMFSGSVFWWIAAVQFLPFTLTLSNLALTPYEMSVQARFWREAHDKLTRIGPTTVGITGSYGKTSVKHILGHILETHAATLITPGSINTTMGIARVIREQLGPHHRFFVCEMGAYGPGSIARLTQLAPPGLAIITAVGSAHYERFKTLETVARAKFELAEAAIQRGGKVVVAGDVLQQPVPREFASRHEQSMVSVGADPTCAVRIASVRQHSEGVEAEVTWAGDSYTLRAPLFGEHQALNIALAFAAACELGVAPNQVVIALGSVPQISHRLEVKRQPRGSILIDDAYNSNPVGFASALRILDLFRRPGGRRILVTPGMVELGSAHNEEHARIGALAASYVDVLLPVLPDRISTLTAAYTAGNPQGVIVPFRNFGEAQAWLRENLTSEDVVLVENDLPDLYESKLKI
jgi:UDP-N-acetylmuramoyl-tripeptide--D-alanyl-D-alanine ligase